MFDTAAPVATRPVTPVKAPKFRLEADGTMSAATLAAFKAEIAAVEARAKARLADPCHLLSIAEGVIEHADRILLKKDQAGLSFRIDPHAQAFGSSYSGKPESTVAYLGRDKASWFFSNVQRERCIDRRVGLAGRPDDFAEKLLTKAVRTETWN